MRISELSAHSGIPAATIKFYTRSGILPAGERVGQTQTRYGEEHVARLRLVRALLTQGGLSISVVRGVLAAIDNPDVPLAFAIAAAHDALPEPDETPSPAAIALVHDVMRKRGWVVHDDNAGIAMAAAAIDAYDDIGRADLTEAIDGYAEAADVIAKADLDVTAAAGSRERAAETVIVGTIIGDRIIAGLRRIAQASTYRDTNADASVDPYADGADDEEEGEEGGDDAGVDGTTSAHPETASDADTDPDTETGTDTDTDTDTDGA